MRPRQEERQRRYAAASGGSGSGRGGAASSNPKALVSILRHSSSEPATLRRTSSENLEGLLVRYAKTLKAVVQLRPKP